MNNLIRILSEYDWNGYYLTSLGITRKYVNIKIRDKDNWGYHTIVTIEINNINRHYLCIPEDTIEGPYEELKEFLSPKIKSIIHEES